MKPQRILIVDDSEGDRKYYRGLLAEAYGSSFELRETDTGERGIAVCKQMKPDCILLDYRLPDMDAVELLGRLGTEYCGHKQILSRGRDNRGDSRGQTTLPLCVPVVILTSLANDHMATAALRAGAQDYLVKDNITAESLSLAILRATEKVHLMGELEAERDRIAQSLAEKEILIKEVHHRVKNNLQVIASLLRIQSTGVSDPSAAAILRDSQQRVEAMALIHEQLYESVDLKQVDFEQNARVLIANLFLSYGVDSERIRSSVNVRGAAGETLRIDIHRAIPIGLILNELISNALRHAFPAGATGQVQVSALVRDNRLILEVADDGAGLPDHLNVANTKSLGLQIVHILARQLNGKVSVETGHGTRFRISLPESEQSASTWKHGSTESSRTHWKTENTAQQAAVSSS